MANLTELEPWERSNAGVGIRAKPKPRSPEPWNLVHGGALGAVDN